MNIVDFSAAKAAKSGQVTPAQVIEGLAGFAADLQDVIVIGRSRGGQILTGYSTMDEAEVVGLVEIAKHEIISAGGDSY